MGRGGSGAWDITSVPLPVWLAVNLPNTIPFPHACPTHGLPSDSTSGPVPDLASEVLKAPGSQDSLTKLSTFYIGGIWASGRRGAGTRSHRMSVTEWPHPSLVPGNCLLAQGRQEHSI